MCTPYAKITIENPSRLLPYVNQLILYDIWDQPCHKTGRSELAGIWGQELIPHQQMLDLNLKLDWKSNKYIQRLSQEIYTKLFFNLKIF